MSDALLRRTLPALCLVLALPLRAAAAMDAGDDQYRYLVGLVDKGLYELAAEEAQAFLRAHPRHEKATLARYRLATALFELGRREESAPHYEALAGGAGFEYRTEALFRLGQCRLDAERFDDAERAFAAVVDGPQDYLRGPATFLAGEAALRAGRPAEARARYEALLERFPDSEHAADAERGLCWCAFQEGDAAATIRLAERFLGRRREHASGPEILVLLGEAYLSNERAGDARRAFDRVPEGPFSDAALRGAGFACAALGEHADAAARFQRLLAEHPESRYAAEARLQLGIERLRAGDAAGAERALGERALADDPEALYWLAEAQEERAPERALQTLDRAAERSPSEALRGRIEIARGDLLTRLGRTPDALRAYERGGSDYALWAAAVAALNQGDAQSAARYSEKLVAAHPESEYADDARLALGEAAFAREDWAGAEERFAEALAATDDPALAARARSRLAWCAYLAGAPERAAARFGELCARHPEAPEAEEGLAMLGRARREADDERGALEAFTAYLARFPDGPHADEALFGTAELAPARAAARTFEELLARHPESPLAARAHLALGDLLAARGQHQAAREHYRALLGAGDGGDGAPEARYGLAWSLYEGGSPVEVGEAAETLAPFLRAGRADPELRGAALELLVHARARAGDAAGATEAWRAFAAVSEGDERRFRAARAVVDAWKAAGEPSRGQAVLDELLGGVRDRDIAVDVLVEGAYLALDEGDVDRAEAQVRVAARRAEDRPSVAEASFFVGEARFERGEDERARALYAAAAQAGGTVEARALYKLGFCLLRAGDSAGAARAFEAVVEGHEESELWGESLFLLGEARFRADDLDGASDALALLCRKLPGHEVAPKALFRLGLALGRLERWQEAEAALARLAKDHPDFPNAAEAELWRGRALAAQGSGRAARQAFERVLALDEGELAAAARLGIGALAEREGRLDEALSEYLKVAVLYAHDELVAEALVRAGGALEALGQPEKAADRYREVLRVHPRARFAADARDRLARLEKR